jgi:hypothetical protein
MQTQETESAERSATAAAELRRLLNRIIANVEAKSIDQSEWWATEIDTIAERMRPLWSQIGIERPGLSVEVWEPPATDPSAKPRRKSAKPKRWHRSLVMRDPDTGAKRTIMLAAGDDCQRWNATARAVEPLLYVVQSWIDWVDLIQHETRHKTEGTLSDWEEALNALGTKPKILAIKLKESANGLTHKEMLKTGGVDGNDSAAARVARNRIEVAWNKLRQKWIAERFYIKEVANPDNKREPRYRVCSEKIDV